MYPAPSTIVKLLSNIPWDNTYNDVLTFGSLSEQTLYFNSKATFTFTNFTYQRYNPDRGQIAAIRIPILADTLYRCNYLMFQNSAHGNKWFYAFIRELNYINESVTEIIYELDIMQTWKFDYTIKECFVEREHTNDDSIGSNLVDENLELGDYVMGNPFVMPQFSPSNSKICVLASFDSMLQPSQGRKYANVYSGLSINIFDSVEDVQAFLKDVDFGGKTDGIVSIFQYPAAFISDDPRAIPIEITKSKHYSSIDGYVPRNNKLFTYPYNFLYVTNNNGNTAEFKWEFFETNPVVVTVFGALTPNPQFVLAPNNYKLTTGTSGDFNINEMITLEGFPQCAFTSDVYKVYLAQNATQLRTMAVTEGLKAIGNVASLDAGGLFNQAANIAHTLAKINDIKVLPQQAKGNQTGNTVYAMGMNSFALFDAYITRKYARIIDDYFDMYGYATHLVKKPNVVGRKSWNYVKCINAQIKGNIPANDLSRINQVFNDGCTFWHTDDIGNYSLDNSIV